MRLSFLLIVFTVVGLAACASSAPAQYANPYDEYPYSPYYEPYDGYYYPYGGYGYPEYSYPQFYGGFFGFPYEDEFGHGEREEGFEHREGREGFEGGERGGEAEHGERGGEAEHGERGGR